MSQVEQEEAEDMQQAQEMELVKQASNIAKAPILDPSKNPELINQQNGQTNPDQAAAAQQEAGTPGGGLLG
jgi:hypothetical protein